ncbi:hypothetical protein PAERUG_P6_East_of_England_6_IMP_1_03_09_02259 [Pseudomonas aeruginosa]|nr:hypothetical protein PAERUG_P6_East_of_England_6_IMP_1_03_09_02259 [Pseudomonas aeruginosa]
MQQVAVGRMHLRDLEAGSQGALGGAYEGLHQRLDLRLAQGLGGRVLGIERDRRRRHRYPAAVADRHAAVLAQPRPPGTRLAPGVGQLDPGDRALGLDETGDAMQRLDMRVAPDAEVVSGDAPLGQHRGGFDYHQAGAAHRAAAQVHEMPVVGQALLRRVLAHGRYGDAVGQGDLTQAKRLEQQTHGRTPGRSWNKCSHLNFRPGSRRPTAQAT